MASSTRASRMSRARSWDSTILWRSATKRSESGFTTIRGQDTPDGDAAVAGGTPALLQEDTGAAVPTLLFEFAEADVDAHYAVLIANGENGDVARDVVLGLDDLLRSLRNGGAIAER